MSLEKGVWFRLSVSGMFYEHVGAAEDVSCVVVNGKHFYPRSIETEQADSAAAEHLCVECGSEVLGEFTLCGACGKDLLRG